MERTPPVSAPDTSPTVRQEGARLGGGPGGRAAFSRFRFEEAQFAQWQMEASRVPAPPFGETPRAEWLSDRFRELGLKNIEIDEVGNVFGVRPGYGQRYIAV